MCVGNSDIRKKERAHVYARCDLESTTLSCGREIHLSRPIYRFIDMDNAAMSHVIVLSSEHTHTVNLNLKSSWLGFFTLIIKDIHGE